MRIGIVSDIHGNLEALTVVLRNLDEEGIDALVCCGDTVGYGPDPNKCIEVLKQHPVRCVRGNHDAASLLQTELTRFSKAGRRAVRWTHKQLSAESRSYLDQLPSVEQLDMGGISTSLVHGSPADPLWGYILRRRDAYLGFRLSEGKPYLQLFGHTHLPSLFALQGNDVVRESVQGECRLLPQEERRYLLNPGSVGQPRDGDWRASFCVLELEDPELWRVRFHRLEYDAEKTRQKILHAGLPEELGTRLLTGT